MVINDTKIVFTDEDAIKAIRGNLTSEDERFFYIENADMRYTIAKSGVTFVKTTK